MAFVARIDFFITVKAQKHILPCGCVVASLIAMLTPRRTVFAIEAIVKSFFVNDSFTV